MRFSQARLSSGFSQSGKVHHQQGNRCRNDCCHCGNQQYLVIDILHDFFCFGPDIRGSKSRLTEHHGHHHAQKSGVCYSGNGDVGPKPVFMFRLPWDLGIITFFNLQTSCIFLLKTIKKTTPALDVVFQTTGLERKKTPCKKVSFCRRIRFWI